MWKVDSFDWFTDSAVTYKHINYKNKINNYKFHISHACLTLEIAINLYQNFMTTISVYILVFLDSVNLFSSFVLSSENTMVISSQVKISFNALCIEFCGGKFHWEDSCFCKSSYHAPTYSHKNLHKWKSDLLLEKVIVSINSKVLCKYAIIKIRVIIIYL